MMIFEKGVSDASPTILSVLAIGGLVATVISAFRSAPKVEKRVKEAKEERMTKVEMVLHVAPALVQTIGLATGTALCIAGSDALNLQNQAKLLGAYTLLNTSYKKYRGKVREIWDSETFDADKKIMSEIAKDRIEENPPAIEEIDEEEKEDEKPLWYDIYGDRYFHATEQEVLTAEYHINRNFALKNAVTLNEFYEFLGLEKIDYGETVGWGLSVGFDTYGYCWIDFKHSLVTMDDGLECRIIYYPFEPTADFLD